MRNTIFILVLVFFAASCEKDLYLEGGPGNKQEYGRNNAEVGALQRPFSATFTTISDGSLFCLYSGIEILEDLCGTEDGSYIAGGGPITGNATHVGLIQEDKSFWKVTGVLLSESMVTIGPADEDVIPEFLTQYISGEIHSANGDYYVYKGEATVNVLTSVLTGKMDFTGGTGRFEGVSGSISLEGTADTSGNGTFKGNGVIIYPR